MPEFTGTLPPEEDLTKARDERCVPAANEAFKMIAAYSKGILGAVDQETIGASYDELTKDILKMFLARNIMITDVKYIHVLLSTIIDSTIGQANRAINFSVKKSEIVAYGKELADMSLAELDMILHPVSQGDIVSAEQSTKEEPPAST